MVRPGGVEFYSTCMPNFGPKFAKCTSLVLELSRLGLAGNFQHEVERKSQLSYWFTYWINERSNRKNMLPAWENQAYSNRLPVNGQQLIIGAIYFLSGEVFAIYLSRGNESKVNISK